MIGAIVKELTEQWPYIVIIALLVVLVISLFGQLETSRSNERELNRILYRVGKTGQTSTNHAK